MRWISFFSKLVFICNLFYLIGLYIRVSPEVPAILLTSGIIIIGSVMARAGTAFISLVYLFLLFSKKKLRDYVEPVVALLNVLFLILQLSVLAFVR